MRTLLVILFLFFSLQSIAQQEVIFCDNESKKAVDLAFVSLINEKTDRISNSNGLVRFVKMNASDSLYIKHLQYQDTIVLCSEIKKGKDTIWLSPSGLSLEAVEIQEKNDFYAVKRVLDSVKKYIPENYVMQSFNANGYMLNRRLYDDELLSITEAKLLWYKRGYDQDNTHGQGMNLFRKLLYRGKRNSNLFDIQRIRISFDQNSYNSLKSTPIRDCRYYLHNSRSFGDPLENFKREYRWLTRDKRKKRYNYSLELVENGDKVYYLINVNAKKSYLEEADIVLNYRWIVDKKEYAVVEYMKFQPKGSVSCLDELNALPVDYKSICMLNTKHRYIYDKVNNKIVLKVVHLSFDSFDEHTPEKRYKHKTTFYLDDITAYDVDPLQGIDEDFNVEELHQEYKSDFWEKGFPIELRKELKDSILVD